VHAPTRRISLTQEHTPQSPPQNPPQAPTRNPYDETITNIPQNHISTHTRHTISSNSPPSAPFPQSELSTHQNPQTIQRRYRNRAHCLRPNRLHQLHLLSPVAAGMISLKSTVALVELTTHLYIPAPRNGPLKSSLELRCGNKDTILRQIRYAWITNIDTSLSSLDISIYIGVADGWGRWAGWLILSLGAVSRI
jgi:hypothetical protein